MARTARRRASVVALALAALTALAPGCGTMIARDLGGRSHHMAYGGCLIDAVACATIVFLPLGVIDLPFSFVADTLLAIVDAFPSFGTPSPSQGASNFHPPESHPGASEHRECPKAAPAPQAP